MMYFSQQIGKTVAIQVCSIGKDGDADSSIGVKAQGGGKAWSTAAMFEVAFAVRFADCPAKPVARALWIPCPNLSVAAAACIYTGGAHHTSFSYSLTTEHLQDFADMAGIEFIVIDENTCVQEFREKLRWNDLYYHLNKGL